jgi:hypothetical protein
MKSYELADAEIDWKLQHRHCESTDVFGELLAGEPIRWSCGNQMVSSSSSSMICSTGISARRA